MPTIFVCYRRDDTAAYAGRLRENLERAFGESSVFMDIDNIEPGEDFDAAVRDTLKRADIVLAMIGPRWVDSREDDGSRRIDNPDDYVRLEIGQALTGGVRLIPVLVGQATMPRSDTLPDDIKKLSRLQAIELSDTRWVYDVTKLTDVIRKIGGTPAPSNAALVEPPAAELTTTHPPAARFADAPPLRTEDLSSPGETPQDTATPSPVALPAVGESQRGFLGRLAARFWDLFTDEPAVGWSVVAVLALAIIGVPWYLTLWWRSFVKFEIHDAVDVDGSFVYRVDGWGYLRYTGTDGFDLRFKQLELRPRQTSFSRDRPQDLHAIVAKWDDPTPLLLKSAREALPVQKNASNTALDPDLVDATAAINSLQAENRRDPSGGTSHYTVAVCWDRLPRDPKACGDATVQLRRSR